jgi:hypothetical protein
MASLFALISAYPIISIILALILFFIGFKVLKWIMWGLAILLVIVAFALIFL